MITRLVLLLSGGALGTLARYGLSGLTHRVFGGTFPLGTLVVNLVGSFVIGLLWGFWETNTLPASFRSFVFIGILGGFTTFSTAMLETMNLFRDGETKLALINILANNVLGIALVFLGFMLAKEVLTFLR